MKRGRKPKTVDEGGIPCCFDTLSLKRKFSEKLEKKAVIAPCNKCSYIQRAECLEQRRCDDFPWSQCRKKS